MLRPPSAPTSQAARTVSPVVSVAVTAVVVLGEADQAHAELHLDAELGQPLAQDALGARLAQHHRVRVRHVRRRVDDRERGALPHELPLTRALLDQFAWQWLAAGGDGSGPAPSDDEAIELLTTLLHSGIAGFRLAADPAMPPRLR